MPLTYTKTLYLIPKKDGTCSIRYDQHSAVTLAAENLNVAVEHEVHLTMPYPPGPQVVKHVAEVSLTEVKPKPPQAPVFVPAPAASDGWDYDPPDDYVLTEDDEVLSVRRSQKGAWEPVFGLLDYSVRGARKAGYKCRRKIKPRPDNDLTTIQYSPGG